MSIGFRFKDPLWDQKPVVLGISQGPLNFNMGSVSNKTNLISASPGCMRQDSGDFSCQSPLRHPNRSKIHGPAQIHNEKNGEVGLVQAGILQDLVAASPYGRRPVYGARVVTQLILGNRLKLCRPPHLATGPDSEIMLTGIPPDKVVNLCDL